MNEIFHFLKELVNPESIIHLEVYICCSLLCLQRQVCLLVSSFPVIHCYSQRLLCLQVFLKYILRCLFFNYPCCCSRNMVGYTFGKKVGLLLSIVIQVCFSPGTSCSCERIYKKHGKKTIILSRFFHC